MIKLGVIKDDKLNEAQITISVSDSRKHFQEWKKCWLPAFSHFPTLFSKAFRIVETKVQVVKGKNGIDREGAI